jgi:LPS-assembly lipoprotein
MKKIIGCIILTLLTSACGWQLRGAADISQNLSPLYISAIDAHGELITQLRQTLKANRITVTEDSREAPYAIYILEETSDKRGVGVGNNALSSAYELTLKADYEIRTKNSEYITKAAAFSARSFNYNSASIGSAAQEEALLRKEMQRELVQQILRRLNAVTAHPQVQNSTSSSSIHSEPSNGQTAP